MLYESRGARHGDAMTRAPAHLPALGHDDIVMLHGLSWAQHEALRAMRGDRSIPRIAFLDGELELTRPSRNHEAIKSQLGRLLEAWAEERGVDLQSHGSWTLEGAAAQRAVEPDERYVVGAQPRDVPDLAIEVVWTSGGVEKLAMYASLGVGEVWVWQAGALSVHVLRDGAYLRSPRSALLPALDLDDLLRFVEVPNQSAAVRAWRGLLRGV